MGPTAVGRKEPDGCLYWCPHSEPSIITVSVLWADGNQPDLPVRPSSTPFTPGDRNYSGLLSGPLSDIDLDDIRGAHDEFGQLLLKALAVHPAGRA